MRLITVMMIKVVSEESLDILENWVCELFSGVKKGARTKVEPRMELPIWKAGKIYWLKAVKDVHVLDLSWTLPSLRHDYLKKIEDYLAHLLGHEGRGSLLSFLKARGWVTYISAGVGDEGMHHSTIAYVFGMSIHLTDSGLEKIFEIIGFVYEYIKLLHQVSPQEWIFKELQDIGNMDFRFAEEKPQDEYAAELADIQHEPWFGLEYTEEDIPSSLLKLWQDPPEIDASLHLPLKNEFIPCDFSIRADKSSSDLVEVPIPKCILDEPLMKFWYKLDNTFKVPHANTYFCITLNGGCSNLKNALLTELFVHLLKDELNEIVYQASVAKLGTSVSLYGDKLELKVYGFNDKLPVLLPKVLATAKSFSPKDDRFKVIKEDMERTLKNTNMKPLDHSSYLRLQVLCQCFWDVEEKLCMLNNLSLADLSAFIPDLLSQLYIEGLCHGNLLEEAILVSDIFKSHFSGPPLPLQVRHKEYAMCLPCSADLVRDVRVKNKLEKNSVVEMYFQIEPEVGTGLIKLKALVDLFDEIVDEPLFNQLRTKEQLGYVVDCSPRLTYRVMGFCFRVQSSEYNPVYLQERIDNFLNGMEGILEGLDNESFENYKSSLTGKLLGKDPSLSYETNRFWCQVVGKRYMFDLSEKEALEFRSIQKADVMDWYRTYLKQPSPKCRRLAVRVWGCNSGWKDVGSQKMTSGQVIEDLAALKLSSVFYPGMC